MLRRVVLPGLIAAALFGGAGAAQAQVGVDIGIHLGSPPPLVAVPSSPVMYAPSVNANVFFYGNQYYVFRRGAWYASPRHEGPWAAVGPEFVPRPILAVPVRYYRVPPAEWRAWHHEAPPHWQPAYGRRWQEHPAAVRAENREERRELRHEEKR
jgi:hypothetical protein